MSCVTRPIRICKAGVLLAALALLGTTSAAAARPLSGAPNCTMFPGSSPWNQRVDRLPVAAGSAALLRSTAISRLHADFSDADVDGYGIPYNVVGATTTRSTVTFEYDDESDHVGYPIPANPKIEAGGDRHILMVDRDACTLYELYAAEQLDTGRWTAGSGAIWDLRSNALRPAGWTSADAAGLPILPGLARHEELAAGGIDHALRITLPTTQRAYIWPARHYASDQRAASLAPMGLRLRVRAAFDTSRFAPQTRAILDAGKRYGFIVADNGSAGFISGAPAAGWDDDDLHSLHDVPMSALEVIDASSLPGTPRTTRIWNASWQRFGASSMRASMFLSRSGHVTATASKGGRVVARKRIAARQGLVRITLPRVARATYRLAPS